MSQVSTKDLPYEALPPSRYSDDIESQPVSNEQQALPYTGAPPSHYPLEIRGQVVPQAQSTIPYEGTPPYTENAPYTAALSSTSADPHASDPASTAPPPSYTASTDTPSADMSSVDKSSADMTSSSLLLHVYHSGMSHRNTQILGRDKVTVLYTVKINNGGLFCEKPHVTVYKGTTGTAVGSATFHSSTREIELVVHNNPLTLSSAGLFTSTHEWTSLATTMEGTRMRLKWKKDRRDMICLDQQENVCAKFENSMWALQKDGKFEVGPFVNGVWMDEIVVTGLAMLEAKRR